MRKIKIKTFNIFSKCKSNNELSQFEPYLYKQLFVRFYLKLLALEQLSEWIFPCYHLFK